MPTYMTTTNITSNLFIHVLFGLFSVFVYIARMFDLYYYGNIILPLVLTFQRVIYNSFVFVLVAPP